LDGESEKNRKKGGKKEEKKGGGRGTLFVNFN
jgi:hypothetical protein